jgi:hypothetical protein
LQKFVIDIAQKPVKMGDFDLSFDQANNQQQSKYDPYLLSDEE